MPAPSLVLHHVPYATRDTLVHHITRFTCWSYKRWSYRGKLVRCIMHGISLGIGCPIATTLTGICLWTTNVSDIIMYHCHNVSVSVTNLCHILTTYSAQSVKGTRM